MSTEDESLRNRVEILEAQVEALLGLSESLSHLQQQQWDEQSPKSQAIEHGLAEVKCNSSKGAAARRAVIRLPPCFAADIDIPDYSVVNSVSECSCAIRRK